MTTRIANSLHPLSKLLLEASHLVSANLGFAGTVRHLSSLAFAALGAESLAISVANPLTGKILDIQLGKSQHGAYGNFEFAADIAVRQQRYGRWAFTIATSRPPAALLTAAEALTQQIALFVELAAQQAAAVRLEQSCKQAQAELQQMKLLPRAASLVSRVQGVDHDEAGTWLAQQSAAKQLPAAVYAQQLILGWQAMVRLARDSRPPAKSSPTPAF